MARNKVQFMCNLENKPHIEECVVLQERRGGKALVDFRRMGRSLGVFLAGPSQLRKIRGGKGRISITQRQFSDGKLYSGQTPGYGI